MRHFTEEQDMLRMAYRRFLETEIAPNMPRWRENGIVDREAFRKAGDQGFLMVWADQRYGGMGDPDFRFEQIMIEESCRAGCAEWFNTLHSRLVGPYLNHFGSEEQKQRFLPDCIKGEKILAIAMTEPDAGSDLSGIRTSARDMGDHFLLNGSKTYISNGINADYIVVVAKTVAKTDAQTNAESNAHSMALLIVERGMQGFERGRNLDKMGLKAQDTAELFFNDVVVPKDNLLGEADQGFFYLMQGLAEERLLAATSSAVNARRAFDITRDFVMKRKAFGKPLSGMQNTQFKMAEMDAEIDILQNFIDYCVAIHNEGNLTANMAAKAKLQATELEWRMLDLGVQLHGGAGYMHEYPICSMFCDARINRILAGSSEIMKLIIGRDIFSEKYRNLLD